MCHPMPCLPILYPAEMLLWRCWERASKQLTHSTGCYTCQHINLEDLQANTAAALTVITWYALVFMCLRLLSVAQK